MESITITNPNELRAVLATMPPEDQQQFLDLLMDALEEIQDENINNNIDNDVEEDINLATYYLPLFPQEQRTEEFKQLFSTIFNGNSYICYDMPRPLTCEACITKYINNTQHLLDTTTNIVYKTILDKLIQVKDNIEMINEHNRVSFERLNLDVVYDLLGINMDHYDPPSKEALDQCQTFKYIKKEEETCTICLCEFEQDDNVIKLPCMHTFHPSCVNQWLKNNCTCPNCKSILK
jgi:hypothetical protein